MAALNTLRNKYSAESAEALAARRREDGLKTFEWRGEKAVCAGCKQTGRNLNSEDKCTHCVAGLPVEAPPPAEAPVLPTRKAKLDAWPYRTAPRPLEQVSTTGPLGKTAILKLDHVELLTHTTGHSKFYSIARYGWVVALRWGKISGEGQTDTKAFNNESEAIMFCRKQSASKVAKGYRSAWETPHP